MVSQGLIFKKNPLYEKCPSCSSQTTLRKSRARKLSEKIIKKINIEYIDVKNVGGADTDHGLF